jgi:3-isopropylmalate dehydrogenase
MQAHIVVLPGDGIGPEVTAEAVRVLEAVARKGRHAFTFAERLLGGCSIDAHGTALTPEVLKDCQGSSAVLLGAVGGPK